MVFFLFGVSEAGAFLQHGLFKIAPLMQVKKGFVVAVSALAPPLSVSLWHCLLSWVDGWGVDDDNHSERSRKRNWVSPLSLIKYVRGEKAAPTKGRERERCGPHHHQTDSPMICAHTLHTTHTSQWKERGRGRELSIPCYPPTTTAAATETLVATRAEHVAVYTYLLYS